MGKNPLSLQCNQCGRPLSFFNTAQEVNPTWRCNQCGFEAAGTKNYIDFMGDREKNATADHYSLQWGSEFDFLGFLQQKPAAKEMMASARLGWKHLFTEVYNKAKSDYVYVYDAACGYGGIASEILDPTTVDKLTYVGADIHNALHVIPEKINGFEQCGFLLRWDITNPLPVLEKFDYVLCRAALHHTPEPRRTFAVLCSSLKPGGEIAISVYNKKAICREASDDALRAIISKLSPEEAFAVCRQFMVLGKAIQKVHEKVIIDEDLPLLGIRKGEFNVHSLMYYHFLKCFYNDDFGDKNSILVNYDWYHPLFAYRYALDEVKDWFYENGLEIREVVSIDVQHYLTGVKPSA